MPHFDLLSRASGRVADLNETTPVESQHPALVLILESGEDLARIIIPLSVCRRRNAGFSRLIGRWMLRVRATSICSYSVREPLRHRCGCLRAITDVDRTLLIGTTASSWL
jgi:hypothetical protein